VYAGIDPVSKRRHYLSEVVPAGPRAERQTRTVRDRLAREVEERGSPRTAATVNQLLDRYLDKFDGTPRTLELYGSYVRKHIGPLIGEVKVAADSLATSGDQPQRRGMDRGRPQDPPTAARGVGS
jgi:integrase